MAKRKLESVSASVGKDLTGAMVIGHRNVVNITLPSAPTPTYTPPPFLETDELPTESDFLPPGSRMPFHRNRVFTGRVDDLKALAQSLVTYHASLATAITQTAAATGMGGIGKTQLAVEFCYRYGRYFHGIHWIDAREGGLDAEIAACGREMGLPNFPETTSEQVALTLRTWQAQPLRLVVLDNLEQPKILSEWLPRLNGLRLLVTARRPQWSADLGVEVCPIGILPRPDSLALLRKLAPRLKDTPDANLNPLAERLGDLPLALDLAGRYLHARSTLTIAEYLQRLDETGNALEHTSLAGWVKDASPTAHETSLAATFLLSWQQLGEDNVDELAKKFFIASGYLAPGVSIPNIVFYLLSLSKNTHKRKSKKTNSEQWEDIADDALLRLQQLGLLTENLVIHPLLAEFAQSQTKDDFILAILATRLTVLSNQALATGIPASFALLRPHVEAFTNRKDLRPVDEGTLLNELGLHLEDLAEHMLAKNALERALSIFENHFGREHDWTGTVCNNLASAYLGIGNLETAKSLAKRGLTVLKKIYGSEHPQVAYSMTTLGVVLHTMGAMVKAKAILKRALEVWENTLDAENPNVAIAANDLGLVLADMGDFQSAKSLYERALAINEKAYGKEHPKVARRLYNLAALLSKMGELPQAHDYAKRAVAMYQKYLPPEHPDVQNALGWLKTIEQKMDASNQT